MSRHGVKEVLDSGAEEVLKNACKAHIQTISTNRQLIHLNKLDMNALQFPYDIQESLLRIFDNNLEDIAEFLCAPIPKIGMRRPIEIIANNEKEEMFQFRRLLAPLDAQVGIG